MRTTLIRVFTFVALLALSAAPAFAQSMLRGKVLDSAGKPVEGATVTFEQEGTTNKRDTKTNKNGEFQQIGLPSGTYTITANKQGVGTASSKGALSQGRPVDVTLTLATGAAASPFAAAAAAADAKVKAQLQADANAAGEALKAGNYDEAIAKLQSIVTTVPTCAECYTNMGNAYAAQKKYTEAEGAYKKAIEIKAENPDAYNGLMKIYNDQKKFDLAAEASANAAKYSASAGAAGAGGGNAEASYNNGVVLFNAGKFAEAKTAFESASKADPNMPLAHFYLGMASLNGGDLPGATAAFEAFLKLDPDGAKLPASSPLKAADIKAFVASQKK